MKKVLLATRPLTPPWDEASKNFAYFLGKEIKNYSLTLLTTQTLLQTLPSSVHQEPIFSSGHFNLKTKMELLRYLYKARPLFDITHYLFTPTKFNTALIKTFLKPTRGKTVQTIATLRDDLYTSGELQKLFFADHLVVYTDLSKQKLDKLGFTNVTRIYPGIDLDHYNPRPKSPDILKQLGFTENTFIVAYPGEYVRLGATDMLASAFLDFFQKNHDTNIRFVFACRIKNPSDAKKKAEVRERFVRAGLLKYVAFPDTISDMPAFYNLSDLIIFPVENLNGKFDVPLVIIESYACGKPVILSDLEQFQEFANRDICVTIPKDSGKKLMESVAYLKENEAERMRLGENARRFVKDHFDLKNTAKQYEEIYAKL
jgi:glycosyltransferase involved in cell wall biosynthesis